MVEEKARILLSRPEFTTLCYYTDEYSARHMTIEAFVQVMTELLNTPDKVRNSNNSGEVASLQLLIRILCIFLVYSHDRIKRNSGNRG